MWDGIDRRRFPRADYPCQIKVQKKKGKANFVSHTENIGCGGICTVLEKGIGLFSEVSLEVDLKDDQAPIKTEGTVVWAVKRHEIKKDRAGFYDTGIEFKNLEPKNIARIEAVVNKCLEKR